MAKSKEPKYVLMPVWPMIKAVKTGNSGAYKVRGLKLIKIKNTPEDIKKAKEKYKFGYDY